MTGGQPRIESAQPESGPGPDRSDPAWVRRRRLKGMGIFAAAFLIWWATIGLPADPILTVLWLALLTIAWNNHRDWRYHLRFGRDWLPVLVFLLLYNYSRGWVIGPHTVPHVYELVAADKAMFGVTPTVWLQQHFYNPNRIYPWDVLASTVYFSHFVTVYIVAIVLWLRNRPAWVAFMRRWMTLTFAGLATYLLYPAAPPWWAGKYGLIEPVARLSSRGWNAIGLHSAGSVLNHMQQHSNPIAAMPSLHFAFSLCVVSFFFTRVRKRWIPLLALYPLAMALTLSYTAEHHIIDELMGAVYVAASYLVVWLAERWWRAYQERKRAAGGGEPAAGQVPVPAVESASPSVVGGA